MRYFIILLWALVVVGCSNVNQAETRYLVPFDFDNAKTYGFHQLDSDYSQKQNMAHSLRNSIELSIERNFNKQGFNFTETSPDILIGYRLYGVNGTIFNGRKEKICRDCIPSEKQRRSASAKNRNKEGNTRIGSIMLDVQSGTTKLSVWRSTYPLSIDGDENSFELNEQLNHAIEQIITLYPKNNREQQVILKQRQ